VTDQNKSTQVTPNRYYDRVFERDAVKILPGEYFVAHDNTMIVTVLGSCVSVCLRDPMTKLTGMNHFLLPHDVRGQGNLLSESARYGIYAMELLINQMLKMGAHRHQLEAKVFGGANVLNSISVNSVGEQNVEFVMDYLRTEHIPVVANDLLDNFPRKVYFFPETGEVKVRKLKSLHNNTISDRESEYRIKLRETSKKSGDVDLF
jgi:chemotaxis protein CheD